jgi:aminoglycoside phosphotransferase (APT) family kinase protein
MYDWLVAQDEKQSVVETVIVHGDYRFDNVVFDSNGNLISVLFTLKMIIALFF